MTASVPKPLPSLAAFVGLDWSDEHHDIALWIEGSDEIECSRLSHTPEAIQDWVAGLRERFAGRRVGICLEQSRGALVHALLAYDFLVLYPVNPATLAKFRETFTPSGAKDDPKDAELLLELLVKHRNRLRAWVPDDPQTRALAGLVEARREAVDLRTRLVLQLLATLKGYFPQAIEWSGGDLSSLLACDFLLKWPTLAAVQRVHAQTLRKFYYAHNCRRGDLIEARIQAIKTATPLTQDPGVIDPAVLTVQMLAQQLRSLAPNIARFDKEIEKRFQAHPDACLFSSLPGSGAALAPRLLVAFGTDRSRFSSATEVQQLSGIAPVLERSGKGQKHVRWRWGAPTFLRQSFHEFASHSIRFSSWARAYYTTQRERGKGHHAAVRALAFKWIRILFRCWQERRPYDEIRYLEALRHRHSPFGASLAAAE